MTAHSPNGLTGTARTAYLDQAAAAARHQADWLVARVRAKVTAGEDLRNPERLIEVAGTDAAAALQGAKPPKSECLCGVANGVAAQTLMAELARRVAVLEAGR